MSAINRTLVGVFGAAGPFGVCAVHEENGEIIVVHTGGTRRVERTIDRMTPHMARQYARLLMCAAAVAEGGENDPSN